MKITRQTKSCIRLPLIVTMLILCRTAIGQSPLPAGKTVTLQQKNITLEKIIHAVQQQCGIGIFYSNQLLNGSEKMNVDYHDASLKDVLDNLFTKRNFDWKYYADKNTILISPAKKEKDNPGHNATGNTVGTQNGLSRQSVFYGHVIDSAGRSVPGATITVKGTLIRRITDGNGTFTLDNATGSTLVVTGVGYETKEIKIDDENTAAIVLQQKSNELNNVVVIGYGSVEKKDLTGSVSTVAAKDIQDVPFLTVDNALAGKAAGVQVTKTDGTPGGAVRIRVRGSTSLLGGNDPLYVIDGVPLQVQSNYINPGFDVTTPSGNAVNAGIGGLSAGISTAFVNGLNSIGGLNVDDIESITILKDAAATAIYGSKAANGVVIITTKKGKKDMKPQIMFSDYTTYTTPILPKLLDASQYKMLLTESARNDSSYRASAGLAQNATVTQILQPGYFGSANTDWLHLVTHNTFSENGQISVQGGGSSSRYYSSVSYNSSPGVVKGSTYQRIAGKFNIENEIGKHLKFLTNIDMGYTEQNITNGAYSEALSARPDFAPYDSTGNYTSFASLGYAYQGFQNPMAMLSATDNAKTFSLLGSIAGVYDFSSALEFKSTVSLNMQTYNQRNYTPSYLITASIFTYGSDGIGSNSNSRLTDWFVENTLTYNKTFNEKNSLNVLAGTSYETDKTSFFSATASGYPNDNVLNNLSSAVLPLQVQGDDPSKPQSYMVSYYLRANYGYDDKYLFTFTGRADGSSKFGPDNKYGFFPSGAIAWRISKENFLKDVTWIDDIKLRGSYGVTGTQNIGNQMYRTLYTPYAYAGSSALVPTQLGNPGIKWETTDETDGGLDFSFFKERLQGTFDYYRKQTNNALISLPVVPSAVYGSLLANVAGIRNTGYELSLQGDIVRNKNFRWNASFNITWDKSLVTKLSADANLSQIGNYSGVEYNNTALIQGKPLGLITGMKVTGIIQNQQQLNDYKSKLNLFAGSFPYLNLGDPIFLLDTVSYAAYNSGYPLFNTIIGNGAPKSYGGFTQEFAYKNFDLSFYFTFSQGGHLLWGEGVNSMEFNGTSNADVIMLNRWTPTHTNTNQPRLLYGDGFLYSSNLNVYNSSYLKLRTVTFNYRFNQAAWMKRAGIQTASLFLSANNLFTITSYPGVDPEVSDDPYSVGGGYFDVSNFPATRSYSMGLKIAF